MGDVVNMRNEPVDPDAAAARFQHWIDQIDKLDPILVGFHHGLDVEAWDDFGKLLTGYNADIKKGLATEDVEAVKKGFNDLLGTLVGFSLTVPFKEVLDTVIIETLAKLHSDFLVFVEESEVAERVEPV